MKYILFSLFCGLFVVFSSSVESQKSKAIKIESVIHSYKKKFESESSSISHKVISKNKAEIVSIYQGAGMTAFTQLYPVQDSKGNLFVFAYSANCPNRGACDLGMENIKVYDKNWVDVTKRVLPWKAIQKATNQAKKRPDYNQPNDKIDTVAMDIPEDNSGEFGFVLVNGEKFDPTQGNSQFEVTHCRWIPKKKKCEVFTREYEMSP